MVEYRSIDRVDLGDALGDSTTGTNYLLVGTDSRDGVDPDNSNAGVIFGDGVSGERTDTMVVLHVGDDGTNLMMAVPRDLLVTISGSGEQQRINAAHQRGPDVLVRTIAENLGVPIDHYFEVDFAGFLGVVDAIGGVVVDFPHPAIDGASGLFVPESGPSRLNSDQALAYVRSRHYTELIDGVAVTDPTADLGRVARQQEFLRTLFRDVGETRNPLALNAILSSVTGNVRIDGSLGFFELLGLARKLGGLAPETVVLPVRGGRTDAGASVLFLLSDEAQPVLDRLR